MKCRILSFLIILLIFLGAPAHEAFCQDLNADAAFDKQVKAFLDSKARTWRDANVPYADGQLLYDIILKNKYTRALEIGTSTGHSATWIAWALSKTGGKLITIEIEESKYKQALANFKEAGLSDYVDARLANAHDLVPELKGPFDFVFSDADKDWYINYFKALAPKLVVGGCYVTHNVSAGRGFGRGGMGGASGDYYSYVTGLSNFESTVSNSGSGVLISYKRSDN